MPAVLVGPGDVVGDCLTLRGEEAHHLKVRRHQPGDIIEVIDGCGLGYRVRLQTLDGDAATGKVLEELAEYGESAIRLHLAVALIKGQRLDFAVEKVTEVGVATISPMETERAVVHPRSRRRVERWQRLARAAAKQCGRSRVPEVRSPADFRDVVAGLVRDCEAVYMATPGEAADLRHGLEQVRPRTVGLLIGPEGGFSAGEEAWAAEAGVLSFSWVSRTLRADTAAVVFAALILDEAERLAEAAGLVDRQS
ncbi:RsmE family RNA methyltransferase [Candidatus Latescibacterota bacterium]